MEYGLIWRDLQSHNYVIKVNILTRGNISNGSPMLLAKDGMQKIKSLAARIFSMRCAWRIKDIKVCKE